MILLSAFGWREIQFWIKTTAATEGWYMYNTYSKYWLKVWFVISQELSKKRRYLSAVTHDARVYAIGGYDGISRLNLVECLTYTKGVPSWKTLAPLSVKRGLPGAVVLKGKDHRD